MEVAARISAKSVSRIRKVIIARYSSLSGVKFKYIPDPKSLAFVSPNGERLVIGFGSSKVRVAEFSPYWSELLGHDKSEFGSHVGKIVRKELSNRSSSRGRQSNRRKGLSKSPFRGKRRADEKMRKIRWDPFDQQAADETSNQQESYSVPVQEVTSKKCGFCSRLILAGKDINGFCSTECIQEFKKAIG